MLFKTSGIVISYLRYRETSIIVKIFTREFGLQTYVVNGVRSTKGSGKMALYQPMTILDMVVYRNDRKSIQRISECRCEYPYKGIPYDMKKSAVAIFCAELVSKVVTEENMEEPDKFDFMREFLVNLDTSTEGLEHMPVYFGLQLSRYVGFAVQSGAQLVADVNLRNAMLEAPVADYIDTLLNDEFPHDTNIDLRRASLNGLLRYYDSHLEGFRNMNSIQVLKQLFS